MLVLQRKLGERILIGDDIKIVVNKLSNQKVSLAIEAPRNLNIARGELTDRYGGNGKGKSDENGD